MQNDSAPPGLRILVVDDCRDSTESLGMLLRCMGHEAFTARDGFEALAAVDVIRPHIVFLDLGMPHLDGYETARRLRLSPWGKQATIVALTGYGDEAARRASFEAGCDHHWLKPADLDMLADFLAGIQGHAVLPGDAIRVS